jgi:transmembrane sensor
MNDPEQASQDRLLQQAAQWFASMRGPDAEARRAEFEAWLARGALHRAAYNRATEVFALGKLLAEGPDSEAAIVRSAPSPRRRFAIAAVAAAMLAAGTAWLGMRNDPRDWAAADSAGQQPARSALQVAELDAADAPKSVRLADGSVVKLRAGTSIAVDYEAASRRLTLKRGGARFFVAHEARPFLVQAGGGTVAAHGTVFDVGLASDRRVTVRLIEGVVDVTLPAFTANGTRKAGLRRLRPGEAVSFAAPAGPASADAAPQPDRGSVRAGAEAAEPEEFVSISLAELVRLADHGASKPIRLAGPAVGRLRVSGRFRIDDSELLAGRLAALFDLAIDRSDASAIVLRPK